MEVQMAAVQSGRPNGRRNIVPNYLKPSTGSCHNVCKYGGAHTFQEQDAHQPKPADARRQLPAASGQRKKKRSLPRKLFGDYRGSARKAAAAAGKQEKKAADDGNDVEWKDIAAYDDTEPAAAHGPLPLPVPEGPGAHVKGKGVTARGKRPQADEAAGDSSERTGGGVKSRSESLDKKKPARSKMVATSKVSTTDRTMVDTKPPRGRKATDPELAGGYRALPPSLLQKRASLLRGLQEEEAAARSSEAADASGFKATTHCSLDSEEDFAAAETSRPVVPAHRRVKSLSSRSVRFPAFTRQPSSSTNDTFKLRSSRSSKKGPAAAILPSSEEKPKLARLRSRRGSVGGGEAGGRGVQLRVRSLRRRGSGRAGAGFVVPAVALRHQKTLERKRSQRLYNNVIQETATKLANARRSRVKALVGAFESVISKIAK
jgi:hypothetical protein